MTDTEVLAVVLVFGGDGWRHGWGTGGGWGWLWAPIVLLLWVGLIATVVWFVARSARLRERSARGGLTTEEYRERLEQLR